MMVAISQTSKETYIITIFVATFLTIQQSWGVVSCFLPEVDRQLWRVATLAYVRDWQAQPGGFAQRNSRFFRALPGSTMPSWNTHPCSYPHHPLDTRHKSNLLCIMVVRSRWCRQVCYHAVSCRGVLFVGRPFWRKFLLLAREARTESRPLSIFNNRLPTCNEPSVPAITHR